MGSSSVLSVKKKRGESSVGGRGKQVKRPANKETWFRALYFSFPKILQRDTFTTYFFGVIMPLCHRVNLFLSLAHHVKKKKLTAPQE